MKHGRFLLAPEKCLMPDVKKTTRFHERLFGLLFRRRLQHDEALFIVPCKSVHTIGMRYSIDLIYLDKDMQIIKLVKNLKPFRFSACHSAYGVIETATNKLAELNLQCGQTLIWQEI